MKRLLLVIALCLVGVLLVLHQRIFPTNQWGKPLDPEEFWKGRVVWNNESANNAARRYGRFYPPIPKHLPHLIAGFPLSFCSQKDHVADPWSYGLDGGSVPPFHSTDEEHAYWNWFWRTKPKPPHTLESEQFEVAKSILRKRTPLMVGGVDINAKMTPQEHTRSEVIHKSRAKEIGVPEEALTEEALLWAYVMKQRREYAKEQTRAARWKSSHPVIAQEIVRTFLNKLLVDSKLIAEPLTEEQLKAANAWKTAYLRRLRLEKTNWSYINAYVRAWGLNPTEVFQDELEK